ncbi:MAG: acetyltransferase [Candidatus Bathyarchaeota archaeon]|nr:acetyltransferase [Candidatus Bathyarchaeota archaeon]
MKPVVIVGAGGFGRETLEILRALDYNILGFIDGNKLLHGKIINNYPVLGGLDWFGELDDVGCVVAIGDCKARKQVVEKLERKGIRFYNAIHPSVIITDFVELGEGVIIQAGSILAVNSKIGDHAHINFNCVIGHDAVVGSYCTISPSVNLMGYSRLDEEVFVGAGATFLPDISVGSWSTIGAGAVVIKNIPDNVTAVGVPAKII